MRGAPVVKKKIMERLQQHPLFNDKQRKEYVSNSESGLGDLMTFSPLKEELYVYDPQKNRITVINLLTLSTSQEKSTQVSLRPFLLV